MRALSSVFALSLLFIPTALFASTVETARALVVSEPPQGNAYTFGGNLTIAAPITGDLTGAGGSIVVSAPVSGDALLFGGSIDMRKPVGGDVRAVGGTISLDDSVAGDVVAIGGAVTLHSAPAFAWIAGGKVDFENGADGPVTIYGSSVTLSGTFTGDVDVVASDRLSLAEGTVIKGRLRYDAPEQADIPLSAQVTGGVSYTGKSYLPTTEEAKTFAIAGAGVFFLVRILAAIIAAGLIAGLFPLLAQAVADRALSFSVNRFILLALLGFGVIVATPVLILLLLVSFAGVGVALLLIPAYILLLLLSYLYSAIVAGSALARGIVKRPTVLWRDAVFGMLALSVIALVPVFGWVVLIVLSAVSAGALVSLFYRFAFRHDDAFDIG